MSQPSSDSSPNHPENTAANKTVNPEIDKHVIAKAGGRHLVYRINRGPWWFLPKPYAMISNIEGSVLFFYGVGQIWVTHKRIRRINEWWLRVPRFISKRLVGVIDTLEPQISEFIDRVDELEVIGTLLIERRVIEFHWTVPRGQRNDSNDARRKAVIDKEFNKLAKCYARLQLVGQEGAEDVGENEIELANPQSSSSTD